MSTGTSPDESDPAHTTTYSSIVATTSRGSHVLNVKCYSATTAKELVPTGSHLSSNSFTAGRSSWHLAYFPNGERTEHQDYISIFLVLDGTTPDTTVGADFTISLLDQAGEPVPAHSKSSHHKFADGPIDLWWAGFPDFISREALEQSGHLSDDDCFSIRCDVEVYEVRTVGQNGQPVARNALEAWWISEVAPPICDIHNYGYPATICDQ